LLLTDTSSFFCPCHRGGKIFWRLLCWLLRLELTWTWRPDNLLLGFAPRVRSN
jgi:hypothetical protein